jgi:hypothetical protein
MGCCQVATGFMAYRVLDRLAMKEVGQELMKPTVFLRIFTIAHC